MKVFDNKEFNQVPSTIEHANLDAFQEPAPTDVTYNFGATTTANLGVKVATYFASALALGGSLFVSNQLMAPANLQGADQANAAGQSANSNGSDAAGSTAAGAAGQQGASGANALTAAQIAATADGGSADGSTNSAFGVTSNGGKRYAKTATTVAAPSATADPAPSATQDTKVIVPPPALNPGNISSATPSANGQSGSSNYGDDEGDDEGDDD